MVKFINKFTSKFRGKFTSEFMGLLVVFATEKFTA